MPYVCVLDKTERQGIGIAAGFLLPESIIPELLAGRELGDISDRLSGEKETKLKNGFVGYLTHGVIERKTYYAQGVAMALVPFLNNKLYFG